MYLNRTIRVLLLSMATLTYSLGNFSGLLFCPVIRADEIQNFYARGSAAVAKYVLIVLSVGVSN